LALRQISTQSAQVAGFALGGFLVTVLSAQGTLLFNGATFLASAMLVAWGVRPRPAARDDRPSTENRTVDHVAGRGLVPVFLLVSLVGLWWFRKAWPRPTHTRWARRRSRWGS